MENYIMDLLNIKDENINIIKCITIGFTHEVHIEKVLSPQYCPVCNSRMYSRGITLRKVKHPILQNGYSIILVIHQRKWKCTNPSCNTYENDHFTFVEKYKQTTSLIPYLILQELKDINLTIRQVASRFSVSDTTVHSIINDYLNMQRLPLSEIISIDEVYLEIDNKRKYALVILDFITGELIDILPNRLENTTKSYFYNITHQERSTVKYLLCDMYNPYINFAEKYFPNATVIVDSFHVVSWLLKLINDYLVKKKKYFIERDKKKYIEYLQKHNKPVNSETIKNTPVSDEVYLLNNFKWLVLQNKDNIIYKEELRYNKKFRSYLDTYKLEKLFFDHFPDLLEIRNLKENYISFNSTQETDKDKIKAGLDEIINEYKRSDYTIFKEFAEILVKHKEEIINSFTFIQDGDKERRLSNGPIEGYNRVIKDYKRNARGVDNFETTRTRLIWSNRKNEGMLAIPKSKTLPKK